mmetsp:Transcript_81922/g.236899  ORF Transcript_81922/g.236899 Transcript_81922/m.236899 type:complete len:480 (-) Transcript_81922:722-2161(-)
MAGEPVGFVSRRGALAGGVAGRPAAHSGRSPLQKAAVDDARRRAPATMADQWAPVGIAKPEAAAMALLATASEVRDEGVNAVPGQQQRAILDKGRAFRWVGQGRPQNRVTHDVASPARGDDLHVRRQDHLEVQSVRSLRHRDGVGVAVAEPSFKAAVHARRTPRTVLHDEPRTGGASCVANFPAALGEVARRFRVDQALEGVEELIGRGRLLGGLELGVVLLGALPVPEALKLRAAAAGAEVLDEGNEQLHPAQRALRIVGAGMCAELERIMPSQGHEVQLPVSPLVAGVLRVRGGARAPLALILGHPDRRIAKGEQVLPGVETQAAAGGPLPDLGANVVEHAPDETALGQAAVGDQAAGRRAAAQEEAPGVAAVEAVRRHELAEHQLETGVGHPHGGDPGGCQHLAGDLVVADVDVDMQAGGRTGLDPHVPQDRQHLDNRAGAPNAGEGLLRRRRGHFERHAGRLAPSRRAQALLQLF